jgi:hypothetical protein
MPSLIGWPAPLRLEHCADVRLDVVDAALEVVRHRPQVTCLLEVVDVLGEADLVDSALRRDSDEALDGLDRVVDRLVGRARCMW